MKSPIRQLNPAIHVIACRAQGYMWNLVSTNQVLDLPWKWATHAETPTNVVHRITEYCDGHTCKPALSIKRAAQGHCGSATHKQHNNRIKPTGIQCKGVFSCSQNLFYHNIVWMCHCKNKFHLFFVPGEIELDCACAGEPVRMCARFTTSNLPKKKERVRKREPRMT